MKLILYIIIHVLFLVVKIEHEGLPLPNQGMKRIISILEKNKLYKNYTLIDFWLW